jgi:hypothetical protein
MKGDKFFRYAFVLTALIIILSIWSNLGKEFRQAPQKIEVQFQLESKLLQRIKELIKEGKLSNKEAMYYEVIERN